MDVVVCDAGPRDGLQNEPEVLDPALRAELVNRLAAAGLRRVEAASFVDPDRVPQMAGAEELVAAVERRPLAERFADADELVLADTIGVGTPGQVRRLLERVAALGPRVGGHFHDTRNTGVANAWAALEAGATVLDASVAGLGGCPFAPRATGNVATEDLVYTLEHEGVETGVDLGALIGVAKWLEGLLGRELPGRVSRAGPFPA